MKHNILVLNYVCYAGNEITSDAFLGIESKFESDGGNNITGGMNLLGGGDAYKAIGI